MIKNMLGIYLHQLVGKSGRNKLINCMRDSFILSHAFLKTLFDLPIDCFFGYACEYDFIVR